MHPSERLYENHQRSYCAYLEKFFFKLRKRLESTIRRSQSAEIFFAIRLFSMVLSGLSVLCHVYENLAVRFEVFVYNSCIFIEIIDYCDVSAPPNLM